MEKRRAITLAGVMAMTGTAALAAIFTNFGILGASEADDVGRLNAGTIVSESPVPTTVGATSSEPEVQVIYEDVPATGAASDDDQDEATEQDDDELSGATTVVTVDDHDDDAVEHLEADDHDEDGPEVDEDGPEVDEDGPEVDDHGEFDDD